MNRIEICFAIEEPEDLEYYDYNDYAENLSIAERKAILAERGEFFVKLMPTDYDRAKWYIANRATCEYVIKNRIVCVTDIYLPLDDFYLSPSASATPKIAHELRKRDGFYDNH